MRGLSSHQQKLILDRMSADFKLLKLAVPMQWSGAVLTGEQEALYGLLAVNYLKGRIDLQMNRFSSLPPLAMLDMGGSTMQLAIPELSSFIPAHVESFPGMGLQARSTQP